MPGLTIVIPQWGPAQRLEDTLVSVLEHRPADCEIFVVHAGDYQDPYGLDGDELRLLDHPSQEPVGMIRHALTQARGEVVHTLLPGLRVQAGWASAALDRLENPLLASVAPLILDPENPQRIVSAGLVYGAGGRRKSKYQRARYKPQRKYRGHIVGPDLAAGFYRRQALESVVASNVGPLLADLDWALSLESEGYESAIAPDSRVIGLPQLPRQSAISTGRCRQRLFLRHVESRGWGVSLFWHPWAWVGDVLSVRPGWATLGRPIGRLIACLEPARHRQRAPDTLHLPKELAAHRPESRAA